MTHSTVHGGLLRRQEIEEAAGKNDNPGKDGEGGEVRREKGSWEARGSGRNSSSLFNGSFDVPGTVLGAICILTHLILTVL